MHKLFFILYDLVLALWTGGIFLFTFIITPVIFKSYGRDMAGEIVGKLFPGRETRPASACPSTEMTLTMTG